MYASLNFHVCPFYLGFIILMSVLVLQANHKMSQKLLRMFQGDIKACGVTFVPWGSGDTWGALSWSTSNFFIKLIC